ncbi:MAG: flagellar export protein FliJ [Shewanellaceae bacterium]|nr:flagellar export protein FliJ [Shewanellaceae bacterium]
MKLAQLEQLLTIYQEHEKAALTQLKEARVYLMQHQQQVAALQGYQQDYRESLPQNTNDKQCLSATTLHQFDGFIGQIGQSIHRQVKVIAEVELHVDRCYQAWLAQHKKTQAIENIMEKEKKKQRSIEEQREQRLQDESNQRRYPHRKK